MSIMRVATAIVVLAAAVLPAAPGPASAQRAGAAGRFDWPSHNLDLSGSRYAARTPGAWGAAPSDNAMREDRT